MRFNVRCADNYYGKNCDKYCKGMDGNGGHFTCDDQGRNTCKSGMYTTYGGMGDGGWRDGGMEEGSGDGWIGLVCLGL